ncbi:type II 3-dehydroquinate dehydratase [Clostridium botulinum]|uniref:3-dehydroquinate dehydratase n=1 Tax=Clostridium botulinum (strain Langeland / NCTC 10281 / Type F) TaxID=441772 RepID=AROQ_CLOBL|nr:type II 3-dehydroquinate dehydratase [Clostridium botulinum]A7GEL0.1 RecName: Full=3-dehydroquinate dehydratase; Short=3-dehydroquinase; AltName: Full=Type II DHQase [Clostridium botulinum F str. Langeland]ABS40209.1 3-dehydroquinate dehydratase, type II [Clostridium botulinum F str. Langeland]ADF99633.1 3-dehydroquinate dehydratase, type II [Clostridium botulinum F str. 230613]KKM42790.1 3-dehydroquinate dehydratase [Clostridium botulinum]MBY6791692.1 type II 3-dehydroquinate dehydratase [
MNNILVINGPNLNLLGKREPDIYGNITLENINQKIKLHFKNEDLKIDFFQSNEEGKIIDKIIESEKKYNAIVINPAAYSHYSIAILDAMRSINIPVVEVHLSNIYKREEYRKKSVTAEASLGVISGFGYYGYIMAIEFILNNLVRENNIVVH